MPTGVDHGTVTVIAEGKPFEVTTLRRDVETFGRHAKVAYTTSWEEDAKRRDFTLNALYADRDGNLFDPIGGYGDLQAGRVRFIGEAETRIREDYLRILRFFRFHAYYGKGAMDEAGLHAAVRLRAGLEQLSAERVAGEMRRILVAPGAIGAVEALFDYGLLTTECLAACRDLSASIGWSRSKRLTPWRQTLRSGSRRLRCSWKRMPPGSPNGLRLSNAEQDVLALAALGVDAALPGEEAAKAVLYRLGPDAYRSRLLIGWADAGARPEDAAWRNALLLPERWQAPVFPIGGNDVMALGALKGPDIGELLKRLEREWIESGFALDRDQLLAKASAFIAARH